MAAPAGEPGRAEPSAFPGGAAPYGNFPDYSRFHPPEERVRLLPAALLSRLFPKTHAVPLLGLDVGCNSGVRAGVERDGEVFMSTSAFLATGGNATGAAGPRESLLQDLVLVTYA